MIRRLAYFVHIPRFAYFVLTNKQLISKYHLFLLNNVITHLTSIQNKFPKKLNNNMVEASHSLTCCKTNN